MAKVQIIIFSLFISVMAYGQRYEKVLFGDFERWAVRYVTESQVIGGQERVLYVIGLTDTIRSNELYDYKTRLVDLKRFRQGDGCGENQQQCHA